MPDASPFRTATEASVRATPWLTDLGGGQAILPDWLPYWDLAQELDLRRTLEIDLEELHRETGIPPGTPLACTVAWNSCFDDLATRVALPTEGEEVPVDLAVTIPGDLLMGSVRLVTSIILAETLPRDDGPIAWRRGSVLWQDDDRVRLHGEEAQFPITVVDFRAHGLEASAPWFLAIGSDLEFPAMGSLQLLVNAGAYRVVEALTEDDGEREDLAAIRSVVYADVGRQLVEHALTYEELEREWPEESLGAVLQALIRTRFTESVGELRRMRDSDPAGWNAKVSAAFNLLREPLP